MGELTTYECPQCGRRYREMRGALMSDMGSEKGVRRERRRLFMREFRDRLRGIERDASPKPGENWVLDRIHRLDPKALPVNQFEWPDYETNENIRCRRCGVPMQATWGAMVD